MARKDALTNNHVYHIFTRSIANFKVFNTPEDFLRMIELIQFFSLDKPPSKFSNFLKLDEVQENGFQVPFDKIASDQEKIVSIIAYCLMPTHIHLVLKQLKNGGITKYMKNLLDSYSRFFNVRHKRKGPLWEGRFNSKFVETYNLLLHLTRYLHLNPVTAGIVNKPEDWKYSSYSEFISTSELHICMFDDLMEITPAKYKKFVNDQKDYQRELAQIKMIMMD